MSGTVYFEYLLEQEQSAEVTVYSSLGQIVMITGELYGRSGRRQLDLSHLPNGQYHIVLQTATQRITKRVVIQK